MRKYRDKKIVYILLFLLLNLCQAVYIYASAPPLKEEYGLRRPKSYVRNFSNLKRQFRTLGLSEKEILKKTSSTEEKRIAVIIVNFISAGSNTSGGNDISLNPGYDVIRKYLSDFVSFYKEVSYGKLNIAISTFPSDNSCYTLNHPMEYYGAPDTDAERKTYLLIQDSIRKANFGGANITSLNYDGVIVIHAGYGQESTNVEGDLWSLFLDWSDGSFPPLEGFVDGLVVSTLEKGAGSFGVLCHEFGHMLGLPDLYNTSTGGTFVGKWCLMDAGVWCGTPPGSNPSHPSAWCKYFLGWLSERYSQFDMPSSQIITKQSRNIRLASAEIDRNSIYKIPLEMGGPNEYFLLEYRRRNEPLAKYDKYLPGEGLLIWHIDDDVGNIARNTINVDPEHPRVRLKSKDGTPPSFSNGGDAGDPYVDNDSFTPPASNPYNGLFSAISIMNIYGAGSNEIHIDVYKTQSTSSTSITQCYPYPNPIYIVNPSIDNMYFSFTLSRPTRDISLEIYTLAGELVKKISEREMSLEIVEDFKYKYKVATDVKNMYLYPLSSGVYLYILQADGDRRAGKFAIIKK
jgi:M6 family metalloprotease-like protein